MTVLDVELTPPSIRSPPPPLVEAPSSRWQEMRSLAQSSCHLRGAATSSSAGASAAALLAPPVPAAGTAAVPAPAIPASRPRAERARSGGTVGGNQRTSRSRALKPPRGSSSSNAQPALVFCPEGAHFGRSTQPLGGSGGPSTLAARLACCSQNSKLHWVSVITQRAKRLWQACATGHKQRVASAGSRTMNYNIHVRSKMRARSKVRAISSQQPLP